MTRDGLEVSLSIPAQSLNLAMNRFRRCLLIRWEKKRRNYLAMTHLACAWVTYRQAGIIG